MKKIISVVCTSYTLITLIFTGLYFLNIMPEIDSTHLLAFFTMSLCIGILMWLAEELYDRFEIKSVITDLIIRILICYVSIFVVGILFGIFDFSVTTFFEVTIIFVPVFIITYAVICLTYSEYALAINSSIKRRKSKNQELNIDINNDSNIE